MDAIHEMAVLFWVVGGAGISSGGIDFLPYRFSGTGRSMRGQYDG